MQAESDLASVVSLRSQWTEKKGKKTPLTFDVSDNWGMGRSHGNSG